MAKKQPMDGDVVLHCGHLDAHVWHWWHLANGIGFKRPDQTTGEARWIVGCEPCAKSAEFDCLKIPLRGDARWNGDKPVLPKPN